MYWMCLKGFTCAPTLSFSTLPEMCIRLHGLRVDWPLLVLDPFMGTGTTALAAQRLGCVYVGFEIDEQYVAIARERLAELREGMVA